MKHRIAQIQPFRLHEERRIHLVNTEVETAHERISFFGHLDETRGSACRARQRDPVCVPEAHGP